MAKRKAKRVFPKRWASDSVQDRSKVKWGQTPSKKTLPGFITLDRPKVTPGPLPEERLATHSKVYVETKAFMGVPRAIVLTRLWQGRYAQGTEDIHEIKILDGKFIKLSLFFHFNSFFFIEKNLIKLKSRVSIVYPDRGYALYAYRNDRIIWSQKTYNLPSPDDPPPA